MRADFGCREYGFGVTFRGHDVFVLDFHDRASKANRIGFGGRPQVLPLDEQLTWSFVVGLQLRADVYRQCGYINEAEPVIRWATPQAKLAGSKDGIRVSVRRLDVPLPHLYDFTFVFAGAWLRRATNVIPLDTETPLVDFRCCSKCKPHNVPL